MKRFAKLLLVTVGFGALGFVMSIVPQKNATGAVGAPVNIMSPLPLPVTVSGTVAAQQSGNWNVGIAGTPTVNLAASSAVNVSNQVDGSGNSIPLMMRDADNPTRNAWRRLGTVALSPTDTFSSDSFDLPAGKMLVVELVQGAAVYNNCLTSPFIGYLAVQTKVNGVFGQSSPFPLAPDQRSCSFVFNAPPALTKIYADPGSSVIVFLTANQTGGGGSLEYQLYGFLVDCASAPCRPVTQ